jgi:hypothetical protein
MIHLIALTNGSGVKEIEIPPHGLVPAKIATLDGMTVPTCTTS